MLFQYKNTHADYQHVTKKLQKNRSQYLVSSEKSSNFAPAFEKQASFPFPPRRCIKFRVSFEVLIFLPFSRENQLKDLFLSNAENQPITKKIQKSYFEIWSVQIFVVILQSISRST